MTFSPEPVHHQVDILHERVVIKLCGEQLIYFFEGALKCWMIIAWLDELVTAIRGYLSDLYERNLLLEKIRQSKATGLTRGVRHLNAKANAQVVAFGGIQSQFEYWVEIQPARMCLHVPPVTPDVENINKGQTRKLFHVLLKCLGAVSRGERWA